MPETLNEGWLDQLITSLLISRNPDQYPREEVERHNLILRSMGVVGEGLGMISKFTIMQILEAWESLKKK